MAVEWSPIQQARPVEWLMRTAPGQQPYAVVRELSYADRARPELFYRVVTWAPTSEGRKLIGYTPTLEKAAELAWDYRTGSASLRHWVAARRGDSSEIDELSKDPARLVSFYRESRDKAQRKDAS